MERFSQNFNPHAEISLLLQQAMQEGSVDSEKNEFDYILMSLKNKTMSDVEALSRAQNIISKRQSYH